MNLRNKSVKFLKTCNKKNTLDEIYIQNHILTISKLFKMSAGKVMQSYESNLLPSHFNQYLKSIETVHNYPPDLQLQKFFSYPCNGNASSNSLDPRYGQKHLAISSFNLPLTSNSCTKTTKSLSSIVLSNKWNSFNSSCVVHSLCFRAMWFFQYVFLCILYLTAAL